MSDCPVLYRHLPRPLGIGIERLHRTEGRFVWREISWWSLANEIIESGYRHDPENHFRLAFLLLALSQEKAEKFFQLAGEKKSCNITYSTEKLKRVLVNTFSHSTAVSALTESGSGERRPLVARKAMNVDRLLEMCQELYTPLRETLGWGEVSDTSVSYRITNDVIAAAFYPECRDYLERMAVRHSFLLPEVFSKVKADLASQFPRDAEAVVKTLKTTKGRGHLSSLALTEVNGELMVCLANHHKQRLRVEVWKFVLLMENPRSPRMLARLDRLDYREKRTPFLFNDLTTGDVQAMFLPESATIRVVAQRLEDKSPTEQASFTLEPEYLLGLYLFLVRLRKDKEEFSRLWEEATVTPTHNVFESLYIAE